MKQFDWGLPTNILHLLSHKSLHTLINKMVHFVYIKQVLQQQGRESFCVMTYYVQQRSNAKTHNFIFCGTSWFSQFHIHGMVLPLEHLWCHFYWSIKHYERHSKLIFLFHSNCNYLGEDLTHFFNTAVLLVSMWFHSNGPLPTWKYQLDPNFQKC